MSVASLADPCVGTVWCQDVPGFEESAFTAGGLYYSIREQLDTSFDADYQKRQKRIETFKELHKQSRGKPNLQQKLQAQIDRLKQESDQLLSEKRRLTSDGELKLLFDGLSTVHSYTKSLEDAVTADEKYSSKRGLIPDRVQALMQRYNSPLWQDVSEALSEANNYNEYLQLTRKLAAAYESGNRAEWSPEAQQAYRGLNLIATILKDVAPRINGETLGQIVALYGSAAETASQKLTQLDTQIRNRGGQSEMVIPGMTNEAGRRGSKIKDDLNIDALSVGVYRVRGLRDLYLAGNELVMFDTVGDEWVRVSQFDKDADLDEIVRRYAFFAAHGELNPTAMDILKGFRERVGIQISVDRRVVVPKGRVRVTISAALGDGSTSGTTSKPNAGGTHAGLFAVVCLA